MVVRGTVLALACASAVAGCDISFVAVTTPEPGTGTDIAALSEHGDSLFAIVLVMHEDDGSAPVVTVAGDTAAWEAMPGRGIVHHAVTRPDSMQPLVIIRVERPGTVLDLELPILVRRGPARRDADSALIVPVVLPETGPPWGPMHWRVRLRSAAGEPLLRIEGSGRPPDPLILPAALVPPGTRAVEVLTELHGSWEHDDAAVSLQGRALVPIPDG